MRAFAGELSLGCFGWVEASSQASRGEGVLPASGLHLRAIDSRAGDHFPQCCQLPCSERLRLCRSSAPLLHLWKARPPTRRLQSEQLLEDKPQRLTRRALSDVFSGVGSRVALVIWDAVARNTLGSKPGRPAIKGGQAGRVERASSRLRRWGVEAISGKRVRASIRLNTTRER
jgi:hypothetical protein